MTRVLLAEFDNQGRFTAAMHRARGARFRVLETHTPYPIEEASAVGHRSSRIRPAMLAGGLVMAALAYGLEYYSAAINYPYDSGGRPLNAWPTFMLVPFAIGILVAALSGFTAFLVETRLPKLSNSLFAIDGFERASQDRFLLTVEFPPDPDDRIAATKMLQNFGAISVREIDA